MNKHNQRQISWKEAAKMIYRTNSPDIVQVNKVGYRVARGVLEGNVKEETVSFDSVVSYMAAKSEQQRLDEHRKTARSQPTSRGANSSVAHSQSTVKQVGRKELPPVYQLSVQDYFAAVFRRRQLGNVSTKIKALIMAGQLLFIVFPIVVIVYGVATAASPPAEHSAIEAWISAEVGDYQIVEWFPAQSAPNQPGQIVRVRYRYYTPSRKPVVTDRRFLVQGEQVQLLGN